jgi:Vanillate O-demethylase oxygenase C-terminal domain
MQASLSVGGDGFHVDYFGQPEQSGWLFRLFESRRIRERAYFSQCAVTQLEYKYAAGWTAWITLYCTPESKSTTHVFASLHLEGRKVPTWAINVLLWPLVARVARQDQAMVELQQRARTDFPTRIPISTSMDIVRPYLVGAWDGAVNRLPPSRSVDMLI